MEEWKMQPDIDHPSLEGLRVFFVEDETMVALNLEDMLADLGCEVVGTAMRVGKALDALNAHVEPDVAILDVNVAGERVFPVAELLTERQVPIIFATGYDRDGLPETWHRHTILQKPYTQDDVSRSLREAVKARNG